jgi:carboxypeptidase C (cathepsin A)
VTLRAARSNTPSDYNTDNDKTAADNYEFLRQWRAVFPQFAENALYISGESYAGAHR